MMFWTSALLASPAVDHEKPVLISIVALEIMLVVVLVQVVVTA